MKKILFLIIALITSACENSITTKNEAEKPKSNLTVNVFQIEQTPFAVLTRASATEACTHLCFAVYDTAGTRVKQVNQEAADAGFGTAYFQLKEGAYKVVVVAHSSKGNPTMTNSAKIQFTNGTGYSDTFLCSYDVTIGDEPVEVELTLVRIAALCRFVVTDDYPKEVAKLYFYFTGGSGAFDATTGLGCVKSKQEVTFDLIDGQKQFDLYTFLHDKQGTITLEVTAIDANGNELYVRSFEIPLQQNQITWMTGAFFSQSGAQAITQTIIDIDTEWEAEVFITF